MAPRKRPVAIAPIDDTEDSLDPAAIDADESYTSLPDSIEVDQETVQQFANIPKKAQQIAMLRACGQSLNEIAELCRDTKANVQQYIRRYGLQSVCLSSQTARKAFLAARFDHVAHRAISKVTDAKLEEASAPALLTVAGIATDKALRIRESIEAARESADVAGLAAALRGQLHARTPQPVGVDPSTRTQ